MTATQLTEGQSVTIKSGAFKGQTGTVNALPNHNNPTGRVLVILDGGDPFGTWLAQSVIDTRSN